MKAYRIRCMGSPAEKKCAGTQGVKVPFPKDGRAVLDV
jgi:hypothetical protein